MATYDYVAVNESGRRCKGVVQAESVKQARQLVREQSLYPVDVTLSHEVGSESGAEHGRSHSAVFRFSRGLSIPELVAFTRQLAVLVASGIAIDEALDAIASLQQKARIKRIALSLRSRILEGFALSDALAGHSNSFNGLYLTMVRAGEHSGALSLILERLADYLEARHELQGNIRLALVYPIILTLVSISVIAVLLAYVVPKIVNQFDHVDQLLPLATRILIALSEALKDYGLWGLLLLVTLAMTLRWLLHQPGFRSVWDRYCLKLPFFSWFVVTVNYARLTRTMDVLLHSGLSLLDTLKVATGVISNQHLKLQISASADAVEEGESLAAAFRRLSYTPPLLTHMVANGEQSGELAAMFARIAGMLENSLSARIKIALAIFEPLLILIMGGLVLFIVLAILLPILELNNMTML